MESIYLKLAFFIFVFFVVFPYMEDDFKKTKRMFGQKICGHCGHMDSFRFRGGCMDCDSARSKVKRRKLEIILNINITSHEWDIYPDVDGLPNCLDCGTGWLYSKELKCIV